MFLLNPARYIVADPAIMLADDSFKRLWGSSTRFGALVLENARNVIWAMPTGCKGEFKTSLGSSIATQTGYIAFATYEAVEKLLPFNVIRLTLAAPSLLYFSSRDIILDGKLHILLVPQRFSVMAPLLVYALESSPAAKRGSPW